MNSKKDDKHVAMDHARIREFYDGEYYATTEGADDIGWHPRAIARRLSDLRGRQVLDIACGTGAWLEHLQSSGALVSGIDISAVAVQACRARLPSAEIHEGVAEALPFTDGRFDLVTCMGSLEHFLDQPGALREMRRVAKPDARFLILVPNAGFLTRRLGLYKGTGQTAVRETVRPIHEWEGLIAEAGLHVRNRWRDLHPISIGWITMGKLPAWPLRGVQALALAAWPLDWQYQVYFFCDAASSSKA